MAINTKESYIEFGTSVNADYSLNNVLRLPAPSAAPFAPQFLADAGRNAAGTMIYQAIGRTMYKTNFTWAFLKNKDFWKMNRWFESYGRVFYAKFFNHTTGKVQIQRFYQGTPADVTPNSQQEIIDGISVPVSYRNVSFSVIDMGEFDVIDVQQLGVD
jgi:hypothetical protein